MTLLSLFGFQMCTFIGIFIIFVGFSCTVFGISFKNIKWLFIAVSAVCTDFIKAFRVHLSESDVYSFRSFLKSDVYSFRSFFDLLRGCGSGRELVPVRSCSASSVRGSPAGVPAACTLGSCSACAGIKKERRGCAAALVIIIFLLCALVGGFLLWFPYMTSNFWASYF